MAGGVVGTLGLSSDPSFFEDARARAPNVSQQALRVAKPEAGTAGGCSGRAPPTPSMPQVASLGADRCAGARSEEEVQDVFGMGLSSQTGDVPIDSGAADNKGEASMVRGVLSHAGLRKVVEGIIAEQFAGRDKIVRCVSHVFGKTHLALVPAGAGNWRGQVALCGWHFGALRSEAYSAGTKKVTMDSLCKKCRLKAVQQSLVLESGTSISGLDSENHEVGQGSGSDASKGASSSSGSSGSQEDAAEDCLSAQEGGAATARRSRRVVLHGFGVRAARPAAKRMRLRTASVRRRGARATARRSRRVVLHGFRVRAARWVMASPSR